MLSLYHCSNDPNSVFQVVCPRNEGAILKESRPCAIPFSKSKNDPTLVPKCSVIKMGGAVVKALTR